MKFKLVFFWLGSSVKMGVPRLLYIRRDSFWSESFIVMLVLLRRVFIVFTGLGRCLGSLSVTFFVAANFILLLFILFFIIVAVFFRACLDVGRFRVVWLPVSEKFVLEEEHPWMLENLDQRDSLVWVLFEEPVDQVLVFLGDFAFESDLVAGLIAGNGLLIATEGSIAVNKFVEEDSEGPHVQLVIVLPMVYHFRSHILKRTAKSVPLTFVEITIFSLVHLAFASPTEVADLEHVVFVDQQVLRLQVPVDETVLVQEVDASHGLNEEVKRSLLGEAALFFDQHKQVALRHILHH